MPFAQQHNNSSNKIYELHTQKHTPNEWTKKRLEESTVLFNLIIWTNWSPFMCYTAYPRIKCKNTSIFARSTHSLLFILPGWAEEIDFPMAIVRNYNVWRCEKIRRIKKKRRKIRAKEILFIAKHFASYRLERLNTTSWRDGDRLNRERMRERERWSLVSAKKNKRQKPTKT